MRIDKLSHKKLFRPGTMSSGARVSIDFFVRRQSLLKLLDDSHRYPSGLIGRLGPGSREENERVTSKLLLRGEPDTTEGHIILYICPECGDIDCGAYSVLVTRQDDRYVWTTFAYEGPHRKVLSIPTPYVFEPQQYEAALTAAAHAV